ncbi:hypothetical protein C8R46DRAFT_1312777, partial [Mycena filopes]
CQLLGPRLYTDDDSSTPFHFPFHLVDSKPRTNTTLHLPATQPVLHRFLFGSPRISHPRCLRVLATSSASLPSTVLRPRDTYPPPLLLRLLPCRRRQPTPHPRRPRRRGDYKRHCSRLGVNSSPSSLTASPSRPSGTSQPPPSSRCSTSVPTSPRPSSSPRARVHTDERVGVVCGVGERGYCAGCSASGSGDSGRYEDWGGQRCLLAMR